MDLWISGQSGLSVCCGQSKFQFVLNMLFLEYAQRTTSSPSFPKLEFNSQSHKLSNLSKLAKFLLKIVSINDGF